MTRSLLACLLPILFMAACSAQAEPSHLDLPVALKQTLQISRQAQSELRYGDAIAACRSAIVAAAHDPATKGWQLAFPMHSIANSYERAGVPVLAARARQAASNLAHDMPASHDGLRRWMSAEAAVALMQIGDLTTAREHMERATTGIALFMESADDDDRASAIETLVDAARLAIEEENADAAAASLLMAMEAAATYGLSVATLDSFIDKLEASAGGLY